MIKKRLLLSAVFVALAATLTTLGAQSAYPNRQIRMVVDSVPGGTTDLMARIAADGLSQQLGMSVMVENRAGATGSVAMDFVMKSPADGYTLLVCANGNLLIRQFLDRGSSFDPVNDFAPVFITSESPHLIVVGKTVPVNDIAGLIAYGKANSGKIFYGSAGLGTQPHISISI
jgi:tripartite-type tricarboxylate transporter receptor subunit TctC